MIFNLSYFDPILLIGSTPATFSIEVGGRSRGRRWIGVVIGVVVVEIVVIMGVIVIIDGYDLA